MIRLPSLFVLRPLLASVIFIWLACHLAVGAVSQVGGTGPQAFWPGPIASLALVSVVPFLFLIDLRIKRLGVFLANLGISRRFLFLGAFFLALGLEILGTLMAAAIIGGTTPG